MDKGLILVISGPAGSGKSTVNRYIRENEDYVFSISRTTRYMRPGEVDGEDYYFVTKEYFQKKIEENDFLEHAEYCGEFYGTPKSLVYDKIEQGDKLRIDGLFAALAAGKATLVNETKGTKIPLIAAFTDRQIAILKAGGLLPYTKGE